MPPALSVIIPTYNRAGSIRDTLQSARDCGVADVELIVVDDGSTDDTAAVVEAFGGVHYLRQANAGPSAARNAGFALSHGRYVSFLDSDDYWLPQTAGHVVALLDDFPEVGVLFAEARVGNERDGYHSWLATAGEGMLATLPGYEPRPGFRILERRSFFRRLAQRNQLCPGATLMRRAEFAQSGGFNRESRHAEDWELFLRLATRTTFACSTELLLNYTTHSGERLTSSSEAMERGFAVALHNVLRDCESLSAEDRAWVEQELRRHLYSYAYYAYDRDDFPEAARRFAAVRRSTGWHPAAFLYGCLCQLPTSMVRRLRAGKHWLHHP